MTPLLASLNVYYGDLTPNRAVIYARLAVGPEMAGLSLAGIVRGPRCSRGHTLPSTYRLVGQVSNLSKIETGQVENLSCLTAQALVTEPIFWSPDWPALYDLSIELRRGSDVVDTATRTIGLRPLRVLNKGFDYGGKFWVLRGIRRSGPLDREVVQFREHSAALVASAEHFDEVLLTRASEEGVLAIAQLPSVKAAAAELARLSRYAAVAIGVLPPGAAPSRAGAATNVLLAHQVEQGQSEPPPDDARLVLGEVFDDFTFGDWSKTLSRTVIAYRPLRQSEDIAAARAACDLLQRDLAPYGQFAGYVV